MMNLELTDKESSAVLAAIHTLDSELESAIFTMTDNEGEKELRDILSKVAERLEREGVQSFYD